MIAPYGVIKKYLKDPDLLARADKLKKRANVPTSCSAKRIGT